MKIQRDLEEAIEFSTLLFIFMAGINIIWGVFLLPWGILGLLFSAINIFTAFSLRKIKIMYLERDYERARDHLFIHVILGFFTGFILLGYYLYTIYRTLDDITLKKYLIKKVERITFPPPYIPKNR